MKRLFDADAFARRLRVAMAHRGVDQIRAAKRIGVSNSTVSRVFNGGQPTLENYLRISAWLEKSEPK